ncbi:MAG: hypothetical protein MI702_08135, partial [Chlorobiales bacterium]|nr:hypothetical protein [Chlorobiales bacterium]
PKGERSRRGGRGRGSMAGGVFDQGQEKAAKGGLRFANPPYGLNRGGELGKIAAPSCGWFAMTGYLVL